jgi:hypothetical protein
MLIGSLFFCIHLNLILVVNTYVFQVSFENKVDINLIDVPSILSISHVSEPLSFILPWNRRVDNLIKSTMFFTNRFIFYRAVIIMMHVDDP